MHVVKWRTSLIAWANDAGVKIYDTASYQRITFIERVPHSSLLRPQLVWQVYLFLFPPLFCLSFLGHKGTYMVVRGNLAYMNQDDTVLIIGWADYIKIAVVKTRGWDGMKGTLGPGAKYVEILSVFQTDYYVSGLAPYGDALVVLAYLPDKEDGQTDSERGSAFPRQVTVL